MLLSLRKIKVAFNIVDWRLSRREVLQVHSFPCLLELCAVKVLQCLILSLSCHCYVRLFNSCKRRKVCCHMSCVPCFASDCGSKLPSSPIKWLGPHASLAWCKCNGCCFLKQSWLCSILSQTTALLPCAFLLCLDWCDLMIGTQFILIDTCALLSSSP